MLIYSRFMDWLICYSMRFLCSHKHYKVADFLIARFFKDRENTPFVSLLCALVKYKLGNYPEAHQLCWQTYSKLCRDFDKDKDVEYLKGYCWFLGISTEARCLLKEKRIFDQSKEGEPTKVFLEQKLLEFPIFGVSKLLTGSLKMVAHPDWPKLSGT